ncbi:HEPN-associated N-terminal domain-containing protein [Corallococcus interemptor]|uniref:HEPN-associated N-terminal domain-containing protein n=1 Tax=Corallococcus interemptor TaxID=2316720 RepID=UPI003D083D71
MLLTFEKGRVMGWAKRMLDVGPIANVEGKYVCAKHFAEDDDLEALVRENEADSNACDFCENSPAAPLEVVVERISQCLGHWYDDAANHLMYVGAEGGYQGPTSDTYDLLRDEVGLELSEDPDDDLFQAILSGLEDSTWVRRDWARLPESQRLLESWDKFCETVRHGRRYFFMDEGPLSDDERWDGILSPPQILEKVISLIEELGLVRTLDAGTRLFRAREQLPGEQHRTSLALGPPPPPLAAANRMSAAGIPVFYAAFSRKTVLRETATQSGVLAVGTFRTLKPLRIVDLARLPKVPGFFNGEKAHLTEGIKFLWQFAKDISKPLRRDGRVHIDYVPTQAITEYIRFRFKPSGSGIDGIAYPSSRDPGSSCVALFATRANLHLGPKGQKEVTPQERALSGDELWVKRVSSSVVEVDFRPSFKIRRKRRK